MLILVFSSHLLSSVQRHIVVPHGKLAEAKAWLAHDEAVCTHWKNVSLPVSDGAMIALCSGNAERPRAM